ncbi:MAG: hypothetical protein UT05_C0008G0002 [Parcubacteria group bacterium GW2011_GWF2_38_76]|nr:MAG: hypothetical protein UT05_C0008G0002 [Parcubacteria group bacterium GW2011_GWF2_38_76]HBM45742.1 hypothetical protein [Patescibacteria group bacterium]
MNKISLFLVTFLFGFIVLPFSANALTVSPVKIEVAGDPGTIVTSKFSLINEEKETKNFYVTFENFEAKGEDGTPSFTTATDGLATWIETDTKIELKPGERKTIPFTINIPKTAEPGGHFAAIFAGSQAPAKSDETQLSVGARTGILVLLTVNGEFKEGGNLLEFNTANKGSFYTSLPVNLYYRFQNSGMSRIMPQGDVVVKNILGMTSNIIPANGIQGNILPSSIRKFNIVWGSEMTDKDTGFFGMAKKQWSDFAFGPYTAELNLNYGADKEVISKVRLFVFPWQLTIVVLVVLSMLYFGLKKYNKWIVGRVLRR